MAKLSKERARAFLVDSVKKDIARFEKNLYGSKALLMNLESGKLDRKIKIEDHDKRTWHVTVKDKTGYTYTYVDKKASGEFKCPECDSINLSVRDDKTGLYCQDCGNNKGEGDK